MMSNPFEGGPLRAFGLDAPSGDMARDLRDGKRILLRRASPGSVIRDFGRTLNARELPFVMSTSGRKRDGNEVVHSAKSWDLRNFEKNPTALWAHDYGTPFAPPGFPIGSWRDVGVEKMASGPALIGILRFDDDEIAERCFAKFRTGSLNTVSIGWTPQEWEALLDGEGHQVGWRFLMNELLECSPVPIPADPDACKQQGFRDFWGPDFDRAAHYGEILRAGMGRTFYVLDHRDGAAPAPSEPERGKAPAAGTAAAELTATAATASGEPTGDPAAADPAPAEGSIGDPAPAADDALDGAPLRTLRALAAALGVATRGPLSDALDADADRLRNAHNGIWEPIDNLRLSINALYYDGRSLGLESWDAREVAMRQVGRIEAGIADMMAAVSGIRATLEGSIEEPGDGSTTPTEVADPAQTRVGKKVSKARKARLVAAAEKIGEGLDAIRAVLAEDAPDEDQKDGLGLDDAAALGEVAELIRELRADAASLAEGVAGADDLGDESEAGWRDHPDALDDGDGEGDDGGDDDPPTPAAGDAFDLRPEDMDLAVALLGDLTEMRKGIEPALEKRARS